KRRPSDVAVELYLETRPQDNLSHPKDVLPMLDRIPRGRLVNWAFELASVRYGVSGLLDWLVTSPEEAAKPVSVGPLEGLTEGVGRRIKIAGKPVAVFRWRDRVYAIGATCPHRGGALDEGEIKEGAVLCPLHEWAFDLDTGCMRTKASLAVPTYRVDVRNDEVWVYPPEARSLIPS
ncbi:MAG: Rieske 2Fe-2S domain-containing protein, partial [Myxococcota bacterium]